MGKTFRKLMPLWVSYLVLVALSVAGPLLQGAGGLARGHWAFLFLLPFAIGAAPYGFIMGEVVQHRTRSVSRAAWRLGLMHTLVIYAIFLVGVIDFVASAADALYLLLWLAPALLSGLFLVLGMHAMRCEQARSDARYGVEVRRGDPWATFFDLEWEGEERQGGRGPRRSSPRQVREAEAGRQARARR